MSQLSALSPRFLPLAGPADPLLVSERVHLFDSGETDDQPDANGDEEEAFRPRWWPGEALEE